MSDIVHRIETIATVMNDGTLTIVVPVNVSPGIHAVIVEISERPTTSDASETSDWITFLKETEGAWQGDFERPPQGTYEVRASF